MLFLYLYNSVAYRTTSSPILTDWAFCVNCRVPRLFFDQCFTTLISTPKQDS